MSVWTKRQVLIDDPLRICRALRFAAKFKFELPLPQTNSENYVGGCWRHFETNNLELCQALFTLYGPIPSNSLGPVLALTTLTSDCSIRLNPAIMHVLCRLPGTKHSGWWGAQLGCKSRNPMSRLSFLWCLLLL